MNSLLNINFNIRANLFIFGIFLICLDSFKILNIPIPWIGLMICMSCSIQSKIMPFSKILNSMLLLLIILIIITLLKFESNSAPLSFIILRFLNILAFIVILNYFAFQNYQNRNFLYIERNVVNIGLLFSIIAILLFFIHMYNLQDFNFVDPLRNRPTTGGGETYITQFKYQYDDYKSINFRAIGTFREPSLLVNALILPFFLSIKNKRYFSMMIIGICMYLTYSLAIFVAICFGLFCSIIFISKEKLISRLFILLLISIFLIYIFFFLSESIFSNIYIERLVNITEYNGRDYTYRNLNVILGDYWIGNGIGYGFFKLAEHIFGSTEVPVSFLSLPLNMWSAGGILGLIITLSIISCHNVLTLINFNSFNRELYLLITPLNIFFILYFSSFEEFHIWHAIALGMYLSYLKEYKKNNNKNIL